LLFVRSHATHLFTDLFNDNWRQAEARRMLFVGAVEVNAPSYWEADTLQQLSSRCPRYLLFYAHPRILQTTNGTIDHLRMNEICTSFCSRQCRCKVLS